jgi:hypothetical protein
MQGHPYAGASGINNDNLVLVYRVILPTYQAPKDEDEDQDEDGDR